MIRPVSAQLMIAYIFFVEERWKAYYQLPEEKRNVSHTYIEINGINGLQFIADVHPAGVNDDTALIDAMLVEGRIVKDEPDDIGILEDGITYKMKKYFLITKLNILSKEEEEVNTILKKVFLRALDEKLSLFELLQQEGYKLKKDAGE